MSETFQVIINIIVLASLIGYGFNTLYKRATAYKQQKADDQAKKEKWERGAQIASQDKEYDPHKWYYAMPDSALKHLEVCFDNDKHNVNAMRRAIELSIEHFALEMEDDAQCARIIEERVYNNPKAFVPFDIKEYKKYREERIEKEGT
ncbi:MAG: hypothetical protein B7Y17_07085, partial [Sulfuricurvum sp. 24-42-5]